MDGGDCTSLMASIEVLRNSNAKMLLKKHVIAREDYAKPSFLGRWWFGVHEDQKLNVSYDISKEEWKKIGLCGHNNGHEHVDEDDEGIRKAWHRCVSRVDPTDI